MLHDSALYKFTMDIDISSYVLTYEQHNQSFKKISNAIARKYAVLATATVTGMCYTFETTIKRYG